MSIPTSSPSSTLRVMTPSELSLPVTWSQQFTFRGKKLFYNRIPFNNWSERAVEVPLAFDFLAEHWYFENKLEVGNVLQHYENALSDALGIRHRCIVDKFEVGNGITNIDILDIDPNEKYQTIVSISTVEHVGQHCSFGGRYGEQTRYRDLEAPLKAVAKIYDLLSVGGQALITTPFGVLTDGGWYVQSSYDYLDLLVTKYAIPREALSLHFLQCVTFERRWHNPHSVWVEAEAKELGHVCYNRWRGGAGAIAVIELTKLHQPFTLNLNVPPSPLIYKRSVASQSLSFIVGLLHM